MRVLFLEGTEPFVFSRGHVRKALLWMKKPKDVLCSSADTFAKRSLDISTPEYIVAREGVKVYG